MICSWKCPILQLNSNFKSTNHGKLKRSYAQTPTIAVNGYKLPDNYKIEDLRYFTEFDIDFSNEK